MKSLYWTKRTGINTFNMQTMTGNDIENYLTILNAPEPPLAFKFSSDGFEFTASNRKWHVIQDLTLEAVQFIDPGMYRISAWQNYVSQEHTYLSPREPYYGWWDYGSNDPPVFPCIEGWIVGLRMDKNVILTTQVYDRSGHTTSAFPEALLRIYAPQSHTFEVVLKPHKGDREATGDDAMIPTDTRCHVVWGDALNPGSSNEHLRSFHMVQRIGL